MGGNSSRVTGIAASRFFLIYKSLHLLPYMDCGAFGVERMPIYMDRHDLTGATASDVAQAHQKDLDIQDQFGVKFLTYWYDQARCTAFCLIDAPDKESAQCVHQQAHGHLFGEVVEVSLSAVEAFLGRIHDIAPAPGQTTPVPDGGRRTIMFTDIVGSTEMTTRLGDRLATELVRAHDSIVRRSLSAHRGREVKHTGDGIMASFPDATNAVDCAIRIQRELQHFNAHAENPIRIRIGMDSGEPVEDSNDLFGATVQLAARLCGAAESDQILVSETICHEVGNPKRFAAPQTLQLKGFKDAVAAAECVWA
jgi:class 3 adenylate cyclase